MVETEQVGADYPNRFSEDCIMKGTIDLVIRDGQVVDGNGGEPVFADIAIDGGRIVEIGEVQEAGREEIEARGKVVTPGFVDIHTHYDGQVTWENHLVPSSAHGVTTVVMGNCGVGFAPCRADQHELLIQLMEGVEDIPHPVLVDGLPWTWESYPEYLDYLAGRSFDMDVCSQLPHAALRVYVMGQRGVDRESATPDDLKAMVELARDAMQAGALGITTSRTFFHRSSDGKSTPSFEAAENELFALAGVLNDLNRGVMQLIMDFDPVEETFDLLHGWPATSLIWTRKIDARKISANISDPAFPRDGTGLGPDSGLSGKSGPAGRRGASPTPVGGVASPPGTCARLPSHSGQTALGLESRYLPLCPTTGGQHQPDQKPGRTRLHRAGTEYRVYRSTGHRQDRTGD